MVIGFLGHFFSKDKFEYVNGRLIGGKYEMVIFSLDGFVASGYYIHDREMID